MDRIEPVRPSPAPFAPAEVARVKRLAREKQSSHPGEERSHPGEERHKAKREAQDALDLDGEDQSPPDDDDGQARPHIDIRA